MIDIQLVIKYVFYVIEITYTLFIKLIPTYIDCALEFLNINQEPPKSIRNKVILVTGGGQGLGKEIAISLARYDNQCKIVIADINLAAAKETVDYLRINMYTKAYAIHVDVADYNSVVQLHKNIVADIGIVDILINNAGMITFLSLMEKQWSDVERVINVNFKSHFLMSRIFLSDMIKQKSGHIVGISSMSGGFPGPYRITYSATKAGVDSFMKCLSTELMVDGRADYIKTSLVLPYFIQTRTEIKDYVEQNFTIPALKPFEAAHSIVDGILKNEEEIFLPKTISLIKFMTILPLKAYKKFLMQMHKNMPTMSSFRKSVPY